MQVTPADYYSREVERINQELAQAFKKLKRYPKRHPSKERRKIQKEIRKLYEQLQDFKFRAAYYL